jgi:EEF1A N-terminal glycine/lysine methyltransferase
MEQGHLLWNAGRTVSDFLEENATSLVHGRCVLELGAGAGLPSLVCALKGAIRVVLTDYPDSDLIDNLRHNVANCGLLSVKTNISVEVRDQPQCTTNGKS